MCTILVISQNFILFSGIYGYYRKRGCSCAVWPEPSVRVSCWYLEGPLAAHVLAKKVCALFIA